MDWIQTGQEKWGEVLTILSQSQVRRKQERLHSAVK